MSVKVYVGNLPSNLTRADLLEHFSDVRDNILKIDVAADRDNRFRGYCYFFVSDEETANQFCDHYNKSAMQGRHLRVTRSLQRHHYDYGFTDAVTA